MSLDPVFTAEFADAGFLEPLPDDARIVAVGRHAPGRRRGRDLGRRAGRGAPVGQHPGAVVPQVAGAEGRPRHDRARSPGTRSSTPPPSNGATVGVQANKYEGYVVWINALVEGAGGVDRERHRGRSRRIRGHRLGGRHRRPPRSSARSPPPRPRSRTCRSPTRARCSARSRSDAGGLHGQLDLRLQQLRRRRDRHRRPRLGPLPGDRRGRAVPAPDRRHQRRREPLRRATRTSRSRPCECITSVENQVTYAIETANMPARQAAYHDPELREQFPADLLELWQSSIDTAGPRPASPYWSTIVNATLSRWHPADSVDPDSTPAGVGELHRGRAPRGRCCSSAAAGGGRHEHRDRRRPARARATDRSRAEERLAWKLVAPAVVVMLARHRVPDAPGAVPVALPVPR